MVTIRSTLLFSYKHITSLIDTTLILTCIGNSVREVSLEYSVESTSSGVCVTCTFLDNSATDCVAVVHQRISQLSSSGLMNIESSQKFNRFGDTASGCIEAVNMDDYQIGVMGGQILEPFPTLLSN